MGLGWRRGADGGVITVAAFFVAAVVSVLGVRPLSSLAQVGTIVGLGVLLDTLLVRTVIVPAMAYILGSKFWWPKQTTSKHNQCGAPCVFRARGLRGTSFLFLRERFNFHRRAGRGELDGLGVNPLFCGMWDSCGSLQPRGLSRARRVCCPLASSQAPTYVVPGAHRAVAAWHSDRGTPRRGTWCTHCHGPAHLRDIANQRHR